jgi:hypothetical protein
MMIALMVVLLAALHVGQQAPTPEEWAAAERAIVRLPPSAFRKRIEFSRAIGVAAPARIRQSHQNWGGPAPPSPLDYDGDDAFVGKASIIRYWVGGRWLELSGSD